MVKRLTLVCLMPDADQVTGSGRELGIVSAQYLWTDTWTANIAKDKFDWV